jgi:hypothetical protein
MQALFTICKKEYQIGFLNRHLRLLLHLHSDWCLVYPFFYPASVH